MGLKKLLAKLKLKRAKAKDSAPDQPTAVNEDAITRCNDATVVLQPPLRHGVGGRGKSGANQTHDGDESGDGDGEATRAFHGCDVCHRRPSVAMMSGSWTCTRPGARRRALTAASKPREVPLAGERSRIETQCNSERSERQCGRVDGRSASRSSRSRSRPASRHVT